MKRNKISALNLLLITTGVILICINTYAFAIRVWHPEYLLPQNTNRVPIAPSAILFFVLTGAFFVYHSLFSKKITKWGIYHSLFGLISLYGILQFTGYFTNADLTFTYKLFPVIHRIGKFPVNHMSPYTGLLFFLTGIAIILILRKKTNRVLDNLVSFSGTLVLIAGFIASMGYLYGTPFLYSGNIIPLSAPTAVSFIFTGLGIIFLTGDKTILIRMVSGPTASARMLRIMVPGIISIFVFQAILENYFAHKHDVNEALIQAILTIFFVTLGIVMTIYVTKRIFESTNRAEKARIDALNELRTTNNIQSLILNNSTLGICMIKDHAFAWSNNRFCELFETSQEEIKNLHPSVIFESAEVFDSLRSLLHDKVHSGRTIDERYEIKTRKGNTIWCRFIGSALNPENPGEGTVWIAEDITERHMLRDKMRLLSQTMDSLAECVSITDTSDRIIYVNEAFQKTYGYTQEELIGKNITFISSKNNDPLVVHSILPSTINGGWTGEVINCRKDGSEFPAYLITSRVIDEKGKILALVGVAKDITESKEAENQLRLYAEELRAANNAKDKMFSIISHDLRSPFISILGLFDILLDQYDTFSEEEKKELFAEIKKSSQNSFELLENLLTWSRTQRGGIKVKPEVFNLKEAVRNQTDILYVAAESKGIQLEETINDNISVYADPEMVKTVLRNLINNAVKFTNVGGSITVSAEVSDIEAAITVKDSGVGIDSSELEGIFNFEKVRSTYGTSNEKGTGLGLQVCKEFVERNGGTIRAESTKGEGSRFIFTVPLAIKG